MTGLMGEAIRAGSDSDAPHYGSPETKTTVEHMLAAHGGLSGWSASPSVSFLRKAELAGDPNPWILHETIEQGSRRLYQDWSEEGMRLVSDGNEVWTVNWSKPFPPAFVAQIGFYFLNMPWITQDEGVILKEVGVGSYPTTDKKLTKVEMTFQPGTGDTPGDRYVLYIDPETHVLRAIEYHVSYGALLDGAYLAPSVTTIGPFFHVNDEFVEVDGNKVPVRYSVYSPAGSRSITGVVEEWSFTTPFDESKLIKPREAKVDQSNPERRKH
jgi:hypothetical protein